MNGFLAVLIVLGLVTVLAWLLRRSPVMLPIPGTKTLSHLEDNCSAAEVELDDETYAELDALAAS